MSMSTTRSERLLSLVLAAGLLTGCSLLSAGEHDEPRPEAEPSSSYVAPDVVKALNRSLGRRAAAVRNGDQGAFTSELDKARRGFTRSQEVYFTNLLQLPLGEFRYTLDRGSLVRDGDVYWLVVQLHLQLEGYDDVPVITPDRFRFSPSARNPDRFLLSSVTDRQWELRNDIRPEPWDLGPIDVRSGIGVLGVFDAGSVSSADSLVSSVEAGIAAVSGVVPYEWSRSVVVYALSDTDFLATIEDLPGGDPESLDGVAFPVMASPGGNQLASTRFALHPRMLTHPGPERDRLIRHELTHVAIGVRDDYAPIWLSEGLAEYVSVRSIAPEGRLISAPAVDAAKAGVSDLPADSTFNDVDSSAHYGLAWWACEYVAGSYGAPTLWTLLDTLDEKGTDPRMALKDQLGINSRQLARKAAKLLVATFDPKPQGHWLVNGGLGRYVSRP